MEKVTASEKLTALVARHLVSVKVLGELVTSVKLYTLDKIRDSVANSAKNISDSLQSMSDRYPEAEGREVFGETMIWMREYLTSLIGAYPEFFYNMAFIYRCALHDAFISDVILLVLTHRPEILKSKQTLTYAQIIDSVVSGTTIEIIAQREVLEYSYKSIADQLDWTRDKLGLTILKEDEKRQELIELYARRNLLVHTQGVVNRRYVNETGGTAAVGSVLSVPEEYLTSRGDLLTTLVTELVTGISEQFGIAIPEKFPPHTLITSLTPNPARPPSVESIPKRNAVRPT